MAKQLLSRKMKLHILKVFYTFILGSVMVVAMKLIYIGFERKSKALESLNQFSYYGYILNPASIIFGPFITYADYLQLFYVHSVVSCTVIFVEISRIRSRTLFSSIMSSALLLYGSASSLVLHTLKSLFREKQSDCLCTSTL